MMRPHASPDISVSDRKGARMAIQQASIARGGSVTRAPRPSNLAEVLDLILDKGIVIDAYVRVSVIGIELLTIDLRVVVASVDTYLRFAEAVNRLDLEQVANNMTLEDLQNKGARSMGREKGERSLEKVKDKLTPGKQSEHDDDEDDGKGGGVLERAKERVTPGGRKDGDRKDNDRKRQRGRDQGKGDDEKEEDKGDDDEESGGIRGMVGKVAERAKWS